MSDCRSEKSKTSYDASTTAGFCLTLGNFFFLFETSAINSEHSCMWLEVSSCANAGMGRGPKAQQGIWWRGWSDGLLVSPRCPDTMQPNNIIN